MMAPSRTAPAWIALLSVSMLALAGCQDEETFDPQSQIGPNPALPAPKQYLLPPMHLAKPIGWGANETPKVAAGLKIQAMARDLANPRVVYPLPNGDVLVVESGGPDTEPTTRPKDLIMGWIMSYAHGDTKAGNRITLLRDTNGDGVPEMKTIFIDHLNSPYGVVLVGQDLYVANTDAIMRYRYTEGQTQITEPGTKLTDLPGGPINHHWTKALAASPDGSLLYVGVGSNSNITENGMEAEKDRAAVWEVDRASGRSRVFAGGIRNPTSLAFEPQTKVLWAVANERDELGPNLVPDYLTSVREGAFYGWPYSYFGQHVDPRVMPQRPDLVASAIAPDYALSSHVAPLGLAFNTGAGLPDSYRGGAFIGEHGSWDRDRFNGYKVVYVPFQDGKPSGKAQDVVTGFLAGEDSVHGRPVGVAMDRTGALLVADDLGNAVWRVTTQ
ncbi:PQQ-dependent sugar dehydrogenase [Microvirga mediterraneensis]|uniref:Sorbosone dehydrogenase family protein n=1 Tax=Microvirga mediterraneensis TaxID=2754695 RepID=A0A838BQR8_9HYPH|nr:sorbosone dehydrogenase family protein [Microvirga mediterraneensis]MBA1157877.1 sorbosone dehydrogenase family protein [Microvirga mediterraneensis]